MRASSAAVGTVCSVVFAVFVQFAGLFQSLENPPVNESVDADAEADAVTSMTPVSRSARTTIARDRLCRLLVVDRLAALISGDICAAFSGGRSGQACEGLPGGQCDVGRGPPLGPAAWTSRRRGRAPSRRLRAAPPTGAARA